MKKHPSAIKDLIKTTIKNIEDTSKDTPFEEDIIRSWEKVVGKTAARHTRPTGLIKGTITIDVDSPVWIYQLNTKKTEIEKELTKKLNKKNQIKIRMRAGSIKQKQNKP